MACGCPVASSLKTSLAEVCGDAAVALEPDSIDSLRSAIERVASDEMLREKLREAGLERAGRYTWNASVLRHRAIYARAAATPAPPGRS
jgi:glycosyltransferase involved in cell wall biosynthesis